MFSFLERQSTAMDIQKNKRPKVKLNINLQCAIHFDAVKKTIKIKKIENKKFSINNENRDGCVFPVPHLYIGYYELAMTGQYYSLCQLIRILSPP